MTIQLTTWAVTAILGASLVLAAAPAVGAQDPLPEECVKDRDRYPFHTEILVCTGPPPDVFIYACPNFANNEPGKTLNEVVPCIYYTL